MSEPTERINFVTSFDLRALVISTTASAGTPDPGLIADEVIHQIRDEDLRAALTQTMRAFVRQTVRPLHHQQHVATHAAPKVKTSTPNRSAKVTAIRSTWRQHLKAHVHVDDGWKFWEECSAADFYAAADERIRIAKNTEAAADKYRAAGDLVAQHHVSKWADLPLDVQEQALTELLAA